MDFDLKSRNNVKSKPWENIEEKAERGDFEM